MGKTAKQKPEEKGEAADRERKMRFFLAGFFALCWTFLAIFLAISWTQDLSQTFSWPIAIIASTGLAFLPGYLSAFLIFSLLLKRLAEKSLERKERNKVKKEKEEKRTTLQKRKEGNKNQLTSSNKMGFLKENNSQHTRLNPLYGNPAGRQHTNKKTIKYPDISILIAAYNEEEYIGQTLTSIRESNYTGNLEVVVVDDGSLDNTKEILQKQSKKFAKNTLTIYASHEGKAGALNKGIKETSNELILVIDADTQLHKDAIKNIVDHFLNSDKPLGAVAGRLLCKNNKDTFLSRMQDWDYRLGITAIKESQSSILSTLVAQGAFSLYRKNSIISSKGWKKMAGEDIVLTWSLLGRGEKTSFAPNALAFTHAPKKLSHFMNQRSRWARGMIEGLKEHGREIFSQKAMSTHGVITNTFFPLIDLSYILFFLPGIFLATMGHFYFIGLYTIFLLPLQITLFATIFILQRKHEKGLGLKKRKNKRGFFLYLLFYQLLLAPASIRGYLPGIIWNKKGMVRKRLDINALC